MPSLELYTSGRADRVLIVKTFTLELVLRLELNPLHKCLKLLVSVASDMGMFSCLENARLIIGIGNDIRTNADVEMGVGRLTNIFVGYIYNRPWQIICTIFCFFSDAKSFFTSACSMFNKRSISCLKSSSCWRCANWMRYLPLCWESRK